ncbi:MAG: universal stress protein [ANME-2 cluster archaeon]|nr:universal stress protein [ANME-2 cluster archaeon]
MIKRILVPVKSTRGSDRAIDFACELAGQLNASIHLITVDFIDMAEKSRMNHQLMEETIRRCKGREIAATYSVLSAETLEDVAIVISRFAEDYDLIIMGHCKYKKIYKFLRDSVAENLIKLSPCPVVVAAVECEDDDRNTPSFKSSD